MLRNLVFLVLLLFSIKVEAQKLGAIYPTKGSHEFSLSLGAYTSTFFAPDRIGQDLGFGNRTAIGMAVHYDTYFTDTWSFKIGLHLDPKGAVNDSDVTTKLNYITIPTTISWHFGRLRRWYIHLGPYLGFLVKAENNDLDIKEDMASVDIGLSTGIGLKIPISDMMFYLENDLQSGISNPFQDPNFRNLNLRNARISYSIGLLF